MQKVVYWKQLERIAREVIQDPIRKLSKDILLILIYGSVATKKATRYSDIDICIITKTKKYNRHFIHGGVPINLWSATLPEFKKTVFRPSFEWQIGIAHV